MWSTGGGNGKLVQNSSYENPMNSTKRQKDVTLEDETPQIHSPPLLLGKTGETAPERMKRQAVDVSGGESKE